MKLLTIAILALGISTIDCFSFPDYVMESERLAAKIDQEKQLHKIPKNLETGTDGGGSATFFMSGDELRKAVVEIGLSNRIVEQHFYYKNNELFLCVEKERWFVWGDKKWKRQVTSVVIGTETRFYFHDKQLEYRVAIDGKASIARQSELLQMEKVLKNESSIFLGTITSPVVNLETFIREGKNRLQFRKKGESETGARPNAW